jgi:hypothetical protein
MRTKMVVGIALLVCFPQGQMVPVRDIYPMLHLDEQVACENELISESGAKEVLNGPAYEIFLRVVTAFGRNAPPRLYFVPGPGNSVYIAGSVFVDGRGKILMSQTFMSLMGNTPALIGIMAHEMAHLAADVRGGVNCDSKFLRDPLKRSRRQIQLPHARLGSVLSKLFSSEKKK